MPGMKMKLTGKSLVAAARKGDLARIRLCLERGVDVNAVNTFAKGLIRECALDGAAQKSRVKAMEALLAAGADPNNPRLQTTDVSPLGWAVSEGDMTCAELLLKAGAEVNRVNHEGETVLDIAKIGDNRPMIALLKKYGSKTGGELGTTASSRPRLWTSVFDSTDETETKALTRTEDKQNVCGPVGVTHFLHFMYDGQPEWSLFAIRAPIDEVSKTFAKHHKAKKRFADVPCEKVGCVGDTIARLVAVVQMKDNPWTVVFRSLLWIDSSLLKGVPKEAKELSAILKTRAIMFLAEETSGALVYEIFENGKTLENAEWENDGGFSRFKSALRKKPALDVVDDKFADEIFRHEGVYLPSCYPKSAGGRQWLAVDKSSAAFVLRADLIEL